MVHDTDIGRTNMFPLPVIGISLVDELKRFVQIVQKLGVLVEKLDKENVARLGHGIQCYMMYESVVANEILAGFL